MKTLKFDTRPQGLHEESFPLFVYSYSSKGFPDFIDRLRYSLPYVPTCLLSLYDYEYVIPPKLICAEDSRVRIWDSGGYETRLEGDLSSVCLGRKWNESTYIRVANRIPWNGLDVLVSYDDSHNIGSIQEQIEQALDLYAKVQGTYVRDIVIHISSGTDPRALAETLAAYTGEFQIIGLIEKEIAPTWAHGVYFIHRLRSALLSLDTEQYIPIHVFGCFDPKTVIRFALAGADIFDGLTWLRYLFMNQSTLYKREIEYTVDIGQLSTANNFELSMILHNIEYMEQLRSNLIYAISTNDMDKFNKEILDISDVLKHFSEQEDD